MHPHTVRRPRTGTRTTSKTTFLLAAPHQGPCEGLASPSGRLPSPTRGHCPLSRMEGTWAPGAEGEAGQDGPDGACPRAASCPALKGSSIPKRDNKQERRCQCLFWNLSGKTKGMAGGAPGREAAPQRPLFTALCHAPASGTQRSGQTGPWPPTEPSVPTHGRTQPIPMVTAACCSGTAARHLGGPGT